MLSKLRKLAAVQASKVPEQTMDKVAEYLFDQDNYELGPNAKPRIAPSGLGAPCLRRVYYDYWRTEKDKKIDFRGSVTFDIGNALEDMVIEWFKGIDEHIPYRSAETGEIPVDRDGKLNPQFPIHSKELQIRQGFIDNVAIREEGLWLYEIKTTNDKGFKALKNQPKEQHTYQVGVYADVFEKLLRGGEYAHIEELKGYTGIVGAIFIYINKNSSEVLELRVDRDTLRTYTAKAEARASEVFEHAKTKTLPEKTKDGCFFCPYWLKCKKEWNGVGARLENHEENSD